ncbi:MAG: efflux RND transporter permease subunit, partial [Armatimonadota bacterium]|nr:efflux RND transporter permease subunit [Armatimonadota bacterium]
VQVIGGRTRQVNIWLDAYKLRAYNLTVTDVTRALQQQNVEIPAGKVDQGARTLTLRTRGRMQSVADFNNIGLRSTEGGAVRLSDVGRIEDSIAEEESVAEVNGDPTVVLSILKQSGTNALAVIDAIKGRLHTIEQTMPSGTNIRIVRDQSDYIKAAVHAVQEHLILGAILASIVVLVFLWNWRSTLISAIAIPTSIIATFGLIYFMGLTLNVITMLALTLSVGIVIDDAIVVLENIYRHIEEKGMSPFHAAIEGTREIGLAVMATTLSLVAVFLPVAFMSGIVGRFMNSFGLTMAFAIMVSLLVSFTLTPMLSARWLRGVAEDDGESVAGHDPERRHVAAGHQAMSPFDTNGRAQAQGVPAHAAHGHEPSSKERGFFALIDRVYTALLRWSLRHRWAVVLACFGALFAVGPLGMAVPKNFLPQDDESQFEISARAPEGTSLQATRKIGRDIATAVQTKLPHVQYTMLTVGSDQARTQNNAAVYVRLTPVEKRDVSQFDLINRVRKEILPRFAAEDLRTIVGPVNAFGGGGTASATIQYTIAGPDLKKLTEASQKALAQMKQIPGVVDADTSLIAGKPEVTVDIDRPMAQQLGVQPSDVANALRYLVGGDKVTDYNESGEQYEVHVRAEQAYRSTEEGISLLTVPSTTMDAVPLDQVVKLSRSSGPSTIQRWNRQRQVTLTANTLPGTSEADVVTRLNQIVQGLNLGPDYK